jgi:hypothetical protein
MAPHTDETDSTVPPPLAVIRPTQGYVCDITNELRYAYYLNVNEKVGEPG